ncbi:MAG: type IV secretion protein Rhs, partial [Alcanivorax sp.]|nr:type IV secretion protein Rhs [Alcanivorax sp.]
GYRIYVVAEFERTVRGELSLVYLRIMHKLAKQFGVPFEDVTPDLSELRLPTRLGSIYEKLDTQAQGGEAALTDEEWSLLHREYIHLSSHWAPIGISAAMKPAEGYSRIIHPHAPD